MAQIQIVKEGRKCFVGEFAPDGSRHTLSDKPFRPRSSEFCVRAAQMLRVAGVKSARGITEDGDPLESESAIVAETAAPVADNRPTSWRGVTPEKIGTKFWVKWHDQTLNQDYSISGDTPQECLENLFGNNHPLVLQFINALPEENESPAQTVMPVPRTASPWPAKVLRAADNPATLPIRELPRNEAPSADLAAYQAFEASATCAALKERLRNDPKFADWYERN